MVVRKRKNEKSERAHLYVHLRKENIFKNLSAVRKIENEKMSLILLDISIDLEPSAAHSSGY